MTWASVDTACMHVMDALPLTIENERDAMHPKKNDY
jgi:hypothetical protein